MRSKDRGSQASNFKKPQVKNEMSIYTYTKYLRSSEGPFSKSPKWVRRMIVDLAYRLAIPLYALPTKKAAIFLPLMGRYLSLHKQPLLFFLATINLQVNRQNNTEKSDDEINDYIIERMFGATGCAAVIEAFLKFDTEDAETRVAATRAGALELASHRNPSKMTSLPEYAEGVMAGKNYGLNTGKDENQSGYFGLHYVYFSKIFDTQEYSDWLAAQLEMHYPFEAMRSLMSPPP